MTATGKTAGDPDGGAVAAMAWHRTADDVLIGLNHSLGNRLIALFTLSPFVSTAEAEEQLSGIAAETERLDVLLRLYRLLESPEGTQDEAMSVADALGDAVLLLGQHTSLRDVACAVTGDERTPPVLFSRQALTQALLLLLCVAARRAAHGGRTGGIAARHTGDASRAVVTVETCEPMAFDSEVEPLELAAARGLLGDAGVLDSATFSPEGRWTVSLDLESLSARRAREKLA